MPYVGNWPVRTQTKAGARVCGWDHSFPFNELWFLWRSICFSTPRAHVRFWKMFCFLQMFEASEKSFRSIRPNERTRWSPPLQRDWSCSIEQQGEITPSHLLCTTVPLILASFVSDKRQLTHYVARMSLKLNRSDLLQQKSSSWYEHKTGEINWLEGNWGCASGYLLRPLMSLWSHECLIGSNHQSLTVTEEHLHPWFRVEQSPKSPVWVTLQWSPDLGMFSTLLEARSITPELAKRWSL